MRPKREANNLFPRTVEVTSTVLPVLSMYLHAQRQPWFYHLAMYTQYSKADTIVLSKYRYALAYTKI